MDLVDVDSATDKYNDHSAFEELDNPVEIDVVNLLLQEFFYLIIAAMTT